jgi:hypothetical protein
MKRQQSQAAQVKRPKVFTFEVGEQEKEDEPRNFFSLPGEEDTEEEEDEPKIGALQAMKQLRDSAPFSTISGLENQAVPP